jgi:colanic acid/amylovoran biosynthesis protein
MKRLKILILHFPNLNNYGTGMMGLITIQAIADRMGVENVEFHCDFNEHASINEVKSELNGEIELKKYWNETALKLSMISNSFYRKIRLLFNLMFSFEGKGFDKIIVLGGDDLSEYYSRYGAALEIFSKWKMSFRTPVILLGQTLGPFNHPLNRLTAKYLLPRLNIYARDLWCTQYLKNEFGLKINQIVDLALADLPKQSDKTIESEILDRYNLRKDEYLTFVISGLQGSNYYCDDMKIYTERHCEMIQKIALIPQLKDKKICILAHTFPPYANEASLGLALFEQISENIKDRIVVIKERILQTRARFILGNGLFTITGRMHAAVSTFQMGKPAICLSYGAKYKGVIGESIGRYDLVIESNDSQIWDNGSIITAVIEKVTYLLSNYSKITLEISKVISSQKKLLNDKFDQLY